MVTGGPHSPWAPCSLYLTRVRRMHRMHRKSRRLSNLLHTSCKLEVQAGNRASSSPPTFGTLRDGYGSCADTFGVGTPRQKFVLLNLPRAVPNHIQSPSD